MRSKKCAESKSYRTFKAPVSHKFVFYSECIEKPLIVHEGGNVVYFLFPLLCEGKCQKQGSITVAS